MIPDKETQATMFVGPLSDGGGYAVFTASGAVKIGPNPLTQRGAELVMRVLERLGLDYTYPQPPTAWRHNSAIVGPGKLRGWLMGRPGEES